MELVDSRASPRVLISLTSWSAALRCTPARPVNRSSVIQAAALKHIGNLRTIRAVTRAWLSVTGRVVGKRSM
jgi:hypothetical protein